MRELYGALRGFPLDPGIPITINTLEGILFMERINDISFVVGNQIVVLLEHQGDFGRGFYWFKLCYTESLAAREAIFWRLSD